VLVMDEGRLVAQGSPDELALTCPEFQRLTSLHGGGTGLAARPAWQGATQIPAMN